MDEILINRLHYWNAVDGSQVFGIRCTSFDEGEGSLAFWRWRREISGNVDRITSMVSSEPCPITQYHATSKLLENVNTAV